MMQPSPSRLQQIHDDILSQPSMDLQTFELPPCPIHRNFRIEAFCPKEGFAPALLCVKCILSPDFQKEARGDAIVPIRDLISKSVEKANRLMASSMNATPIKEGLEHKFLEYTTRDYVGVFERHIESQMKKLDREMDRIRESLDNLRGQFVNFFDKQVEGLRNSDEEIRAKVGEYIDEKNDVANMRFSSVEEVISELRIIEDFREYERFIRNLYKKSNDTRESGEGSLLKQITTLMEDLRSKVSTMKSMRVDTMLLEEIREKLDAIDILDKSTPVPGAPGTGPKLEKTLEKIRNAEKRSAGRTNGSNTPSNSQQKSKNVSKNASEKQSPYKSKEPVREPPKQASLSQILREKYGIDTQREALTTSALSREKPREKETKIEHVRGHSPNPSTPKHSVVPESIAPIMSPHSTIAKSEAKKTPTLYNPAVPLPLPSFWYQSKPASEKKAKLTEDEMAIEREGPEPGELSAPVFPERSFTFLEKSPMRSGFNSIVKQPSNQVMDIAHSQGRASPITSHRNFPQNASQVMEISHNQGRASPITSHRNFPQNASQVMEISHNQGRASPNTSHRNFPQSASQPEFHRKPVTPANSLDWITTDNPTANANLQFSNSNSNSLGHRNSFYADRERHDPDSPRETMTGLQNEPAKISSPAMSKSNTDKDNNSGARSPVSVTNDNPNLNTGRDSGSVYKEGNGHGVRQFSSAENSRILMDFIETKVNGFLVYQNQLRNSLLHPVEDFSKYSGEMWYALSREEKDECMALAMTARAALKDEFKGLALSVTDIDELRELLDEKIKQIKK